MTVVGSGVAGLCVATELMDRGQPVSVVDRVGGPGPESCSWWAGGMLAPRCEGEHADPIVSRLGQEAVEWWRRKNVEVVQNGTLVVAPGRDRGELRQFARRTEGFVELAGDEIAALEPDLSGRFERALFFPDEAHLAPRAALESLARRLERNGVPIQTSAWELDTPGLTLDCRGLAARDRLSDLRGVKGEMLILRSTELALARPVRLLHPRIPIYLVPRGDGVYMLGATSIESSERTRVSVRSVLELLSAAYALHPAFGEAEILEMGGDARPAFPDNLPRIRRRGETIYVNGLYRHGFLLGPAVARMAGELVCRGRRPEVMDEDHR